MQNLFEHIPFIDEMTDMEKEILKKNMMIKNFEKNELIHSSISSCLGMLVVKEGRLRAYIMSDDGREVTLFYVEKDEICVFSSSCVISSITFDLFIEADKKTSVYQLPTRILEELMKNKSIENVILTMALKKFTEIMWSMQQILFLSMDRRIARLLVEKCKKENSSKIKITHEEIAKQIGSAREVVSRMLSIFTKENLIVLSRGQIEIIDNDKLVNLFENGKKKTIN